VLLPHLQKSFDEGIIGRLGRTAILLQDDERLLRDMAAARLARLSPEKGILDTRPLESVERALARRVVREFLRQEGGGLRGISQMDIDRILDLKEGKILRLAGRRRIGKERGLIRLSGEKPVLKKPDFGFQWDTLSPLKIADAGLIVTAEILDQPPADRDYDDESKVFMDRDILEFPLFVRNPNPGDRYIPLGSQGHIKLKEAFRSRDVPPSRRWRRPVFLSANEIVWVMGLPVGDKFKIGPGTRRILHIRTEPLCRSGRD
jgi:tRNA(Ile)-lysidine synthase